MTTKTKKKTTLIPGEYVSVRRVDSISWEMVATTVTEDGTVTQETSTPDIFEVVFSKVTQKVVQK